MQSHDANPGRRWDPSLPGTPKTEGKQSLPKPPSTTLLCLNKCFTPQELFVLQLELFS